MSLFDVIKYPISDPPTKDELEALPNDIIFKLYDTIYPKDNGKLDLQFLQFKISIIYGHILVWGTKCRIPTEYIRKIIRDYNEHI